jgi:hypothetical protein
MQSDQALKKMGIKVDRGDSEMEFEMEGDNLND